MSKLNVSSKGPTLLETTPPSLMKMTLTGRIPCTVTVFHQRACEYHYVIALLKKHLRKSRFDAPLISDDLELLESWSSSSWTGVTLTKQDKNF